MSSVVEVTEVSVDGPLVDGATACVRRCGIFSTFEKAASWVTAKIESDPDEDFALVYYMLEAIILDVDRQTGPTFVFDRNGERCGTIPGDIDQPWQGRSAESCRFRPGQLVGLVVGDHYRVGVVLALPPSPEEVDRLGGVTQADNVYLVGYVDPGDPFDPDRYGHDHIPQALLFDHADAPDALRDALRHRCLGHAGFPPWTAEEQQAKRDPDAVIARVLGGFRHENGPKPRGATRGTLVVDESACFLASALQEANFHVVDLRRHDEGLEARRGALAHRIVITKNTPEFLDLAPVLDLGIIGLDGLPKLHGETGYGDNPTAQMISKAVVEFALASERASWVLVLHPSGKHAFRRIE